MQREKKTFVVPRALAFAVWLLLAPVLGGTALLGSDNVPADEGEIVITPILHGSLQIDFGDLSIQVDPWSRGDYGDAGPADLILVTDVHGDHLDLEMIDRLTDDETVVVAPQAVAESVPQATVIANGESTEVASIRVEAVPMYNLHRGPEEGRLYHEKGRGNGYLLSLGGLRIYVAGDTACTPEMRALENVDVAFVPMNLPYTMTPAEAAECVRAFAPRIAYPYHYRGSDLEEFAAALADVPEIEVRIRDWYPAP